MGDSLDDRQQATPLVDSHLGDLPITLKDIDIYTWLPLPAIPPAALLKLVDNDNIASAEVYDFAS